MIYSSKWQIILRNGVIFLEEPFWSKLIQLPVSKMDTKASSRVVLVQRLVIDQKKVMH